MLDPSRLLRLVSSKTATGICVAALATGAGTVGVMAAVGGSGPTPQTTTGSTTTTTTTSSQAPSSKSESDEHETETSQTEASETHTKATTTETSETESSETGDHDGHGDAVRQGVITCKATAATSGKHGIGDCVSQIASSSHEDGDAQGQNHTGEGHDD
jgi:hypothetical protein